MTALGRRQTRAPRSARPPVRGAQAGRAEAQSPSRGAPNWHAVEQLLASLAETRVFFPTATSHSTWISSYEPGKRLRLETDATSRWIQVDDLKRCWETFERQRRILRADVLEPGRCSAFVMALFARVPGVGDEDGDGRTLVLGDRTRRSGGR